MSLKTDPLSRKRSGLVQTREAVKNFRAHPVNILVT